MTKEPIILCCAIVAGELLIPDNLTGPCDICGAIVQFRPHAPSPRILRCMACVMSLMDDDTTFTTTPKMIEDAKTFFLKKKH